MSSSPESLTNPAHLMPRDFASVYADSFRGSPEQRAVMIAADRYRRWFEYEQESHAKVFRSLEAVPAKLRSEPGFPKALTLMGHIVAARRVWLFRLGVAKDIPKEFFPLRIDLPTLKADLESMQQVWSEYLRQLTELELSRKFEYRTTEGDWFRSTVEDILTQLFGHSLYHRGQIAALLRSIGAEPAPTDFVFWSRQPVTASPEE